MNYYFIIAAIIVVIVCLLIYDKMSGTAPTVAPAPGNTPTTSYCPTAATISLSINWTYGSSLPAYNTLSGVSGSNTITNTFIPSGKKDGMMYENNPLNPKMPLGLSISTSVNANNIQTNNLVGLIVPISVDSNCNITVLNPSTVPTLCSPPTYNGQNLNISGCGAVCLNSILGSSKRYTLLQTNVGLAAATAMNTLFSLLPVADADSLLIDYNLSGSGTTVGICASPQCNSGQPSCSSGSNPANGYSNPAAAVGGGDIYGVVLKDVNGNIF